MKHDSKLFRHSLSWSAMINLRHIHTSQVFHPYSEPGLQGFSFREAKEVSHFSLGFKGYIKSHLSFSAETVSHYS